LSRGPPTFQVDQETLLNLHDLIPLEIASRIVLISRNHLAWEGQAQVLQHTTQQGRSAAVHPHDKHQRGSRHIPQKAHVIEILNSNVLKATRELAKLNALIQHKLHIKFFH
jgi:hypothetical protein